MTVTQRQSVFEALARAAHASESVALAIITRSKGSSPQKSGAKAVFHPDGRIDGTLGGGCLEAEIQQRAWRALQTNTPSSFELLLDHDFGWDDGLICGGKVFGIILPEAQKAGEIFWSTLASRCQEMEWGVDKNFIIRPITQTDSAIAPTDAWLHREKVIPPTELWIAGAGHISQAVAPLAARLDFSVTVFDDRAALASRALFREPIQLRTGPWISGTWDFSPGAPAFALVVTRGHQHDALVLRDWLRKGFAFIGMIGSARKARIIFDQFAEEGIATREELARVACPVGLPIGSETVEEIAISVMAQMVQRRAALRAIDS